MNRRTLLLPVLSVLSVLATACQVTEVDQPAQSAALDAGLVTVESTLTFEETFDRLQAALEANENLRILTTVDHQANAAGVDQPLPPTRLILFGNPALGTPLMQGSRTTAIDLPAEDDWCGKNQDGHAFLTVHTTSLYLRQRQGLERGSERRSLSTMARTHSAPSNVATR